MLQEVLQEHLASSVHRAGNAGSACAAWGWRAVSSKQQAPLPEKQCTGGQVQAGRGGLWWGLPTGPWASAGLDQRGGRGWVVGGNRALRSRKERWFNLAIWRLKRDDAMSATEQRLIRSLLPSVR